jgi:Recombinase/Recombinase zinc beta ribbon domain
MVAKDLKWTPEHDKALLEFARSEHNLDEIAKLMNRSCGSVRMRAARLNIKLSHSSKLTAAPGWLMLSEDRRSFVYLPDRAEVVKQIFEMSAAGVGGYTIAKQLNANNIPAFGPSSKWDQSTIHNMLSNRAVVGEFQPKKYLTARESLRGTRDRKGTPNGEPVKNYYPAVIDESLFILAQETRRKNLASRRGRKGTQITNLFAGLITCAYCGSAVLFHSNGNSKSLICSNVLENNGCPRTGWSYQDFEERFLEFLPELRAQTTETRALDEIDELVSISREPRGPRVYNARMALQIRLKAIIAALKIAASGSNPDKGKSNLRILRDQHGRYFEVTLRGGATLKYFTSLVDD